MAGDFNVVHSPYGKALGGRISKSMRCFNNLVKIVVCLILLLIGGKFTWVNCRAASRINRVLISEVWIERFGNPRQVRGSRITLDHWPLILTNVRLNWGPVPFIFENMWFDHPLFKANIASWWKTSIQGRWEGFKFMEKLRFLKRPAESLEQRGVWIYSG